MLGATAIRLHCRKHQQLFDALKRRITDIDFAAYSKQKDKVVRLIASEGYKPQQHLTIGAFTGREILEAQNGKHIDVFFDKLEFCHIVSFANRLEKDRPTVPLAELILEKMQIVQINEKDLKDTTVLILEHDMGDHDNDVINAKHIAKILSNDWGFYYTVTTNLKKVDSYLEKFDVLTNEDKTTVRTRIGRLLEGIENESKSMGWKIRARVGPKKKWYVEVEEVDRAEWLADASRAERE
jgi:hypothetical protein